MNRFKKPLTDQEIKDYTKYAYTSNGDGLSGTESKRAMNEIVRLKDTIKQLGNDLFTVQKKRNELQGANESLKAEYMELLQQCQCCQDEVKSRKHMRHPD